MIEATEAGTWIADLRYLGTVVSPFLAAGIGWLVYRAQKKHEIDAKLRRERQELYVEIVGALSDCEKVREGPAYYHALDGFIDKLRVVAPDAVASAALRLVNKDIVLNLTRNDAIKLDTETRIAESARQEPVRDARDILIREMRKDVLKGSNISADLTSIEELDK